MSCPFPWKISNFYAGGANVPVGATGINGPIPSSGEIKFSDFYGSPIPTINEYKFTAGHNITTGFNGIHTASFVFPRFGSWDSPLPEKPIFGNFGSNTDSTGVQDTTSGIITMPDGFNYGSATIQEWSITQNQQTGDFIEHILLSVSRWNGTSFIPASMSWTPFNNIIINGSGWSNRIFNISQLTKNVSSIIVKELFFEWVGPITPSVTIPGFVTGLQYTLTFT